MTIYEVTELKFPGGCQTRIWVTACARKELEKFLRKSDPQKIFLKRLMRCSVNGFVNFEGGDRPLLRPEKSGVYRFGILGSLFRLIGFYEDASKQSFIIIDTLTKSGQQLSVAESSRIAEVGNIKRLCLWRKVPDEEGFPRLAR